MTAGRAAAALISAALVALAGVPAGAQGLIGDTAGQGPLEIEADDGLEWRRQDQVYIARGNAQAARGGITVHADTLIAHYRKRRSGQEGDTGMGTGDTEIYKIEAIGDVRIVGDNEVAYGERGEYDVGQSVVVLTGGDLRFEAQDETITAERSLEYWQHRSIAVARGDAVAVRGDRRIAADVLAAHFGKDAASGEQKISRIEAFDNVRISTRQEYARGDKGVYNAGTRIARLYGDVKITRGDNQLNGGYAEVNLETGISRLMGGPPNVAERQRVKGLLKPDSEADAEASPE